MSRADSADRDMWPSGYRCAVSLSFDDAEDSQRALAVPALERRRVRGTFYLNTAKLALASDAAGRWAEWAAVARAGHEIGNHSHRHPCSTNFSWTHQPPHSTLEEMTLLEMRAEIGEAQDVLERRIGRPPATFAYPCGMSYVGRGRSRQSYVPLVAEQFIVGRGFNGESAASPERCDLAYVPATSMDGKEVDALATLIEDAHANGHWLILVSHHIGMQAAAYTTELRVLEALLAHLRARPSVWVDTVEQVGRHLRTRREGQSLSSSSG